MRERTWLRRLYPSGKGSASMPANNNHEARVVGQRLAQIVAQIPADAQTIRRDLHELALGADVLKENYQL